MPLKLSPFAVRIGCLLLAAVTLSVGAQEVRQLESRQLELNTEALSTLDRPEMTLRLPDSVRQVVSEPMEIADLQGRVLGRTGSLSGDRVTFSPPGSGSFIMRPPELVSLKLAAERITLPGGLVQPERENPVGMEESRRERTWFQPTAMATPLPVTWNPESRRYNMNLFLGLKASGEHQDAELDQPITLQLALRGMQADVPDPLQLTGAGVAHERRLNLSFLPTTDDPVIELRSDLGRFDLQLEVLPRLELIPESATMPGLGLGTLTFSVVRRAPTGGEAPVQRDTEVFVEVDGARGISENVVIPAGEAHTRFQIRSSGLGPVDVKATAGSLVDRRNVSQVFPYLPLGAAVIGGALGGFSRRFQRKAPSSPDAMRVVEGVLVALVGYAISVLGIMQLGVPQAVAGTEAGAFITGVITGFAGVAVIERLSGRAKPA